MTNGHESGSGMVSSTRDVHADAAKSKKRPKAPRPVVSRDDNKTEAVTGQASTPGQ